MDLTNASAIVACCAGGFGSATVRKLAQMGARVLTIRATRSPTSENAVWAKFVKKRLPRALMSNVTPQYFSWSSGTTPAACWTAAMAATR